MRIQKSALWVISGDRSAGKTTLCQAILEQARQARWETAGILSLAVIKNGKKIAIDALDVRSGKRCRLAQCAQTGHTGGIQTNGWIFDESTLAWGNDVLKRAVPCDLLVVDELGPLELERQMGWTAAFEAIRSHSYRLCLLVLRPGLVDLFRRIQPDFRLMRLPFAQGEPAVHLFPEPAE